jgi:hypothetical protein
VVRLSKRRARTQPSEQRRLLILTALRLAALDNVLQKLPVHAYVLYHAICCWEVIALARGGKPILAKPWRLEVSTTVRENLLIQMRLP